MYESAPDGVKSPVCGDPVPPSGTWVAARAAPAGPAAVNQTTVTALTIPASVSQRNRFLVFSPLALSGGG